MFHAKQCMEHLMITSLLFHAETRDSSVIHPLNSKIIVRQLTHLIYHYDSFHLLTNQVCTDNTFCMRMRLCTRKYRTMKHLNVMLTSVVVSQ